MEKAARGLVGWRSQKAIPEEEEPGEDDGVGMGRDAEAGGEDEDDIGDDEYDEEELDDGEDQEEIKYDLVKLHDVHCQGPLEVRNENDVLVVKPAKLQFRPCDPDIQKLMLFNKTRVYQGFRIFDPLSNAFSITFPFQERVHPHGWLSIEIECLKRKDLGTKDYVRIKCDGGHQLTIPVEVLPISAFHELPQFIDLPVTPLGKSATCHFNIYPDRHLSLIFSVVPMEEHGDFKIIPRAGIIPAGSSEAAKIMVTYTPTEFATASIDLIVSIPAIYTWPQIVRISGNCMPGLQRAMEEKKLETCPQARPKVQQLPKPKIYVKPKTQRQQEVLHMEGYEVTLRNLDNHHAVSSFMMEKLRALRDPNELLGPFGTPLEDDALLYHAKEKEFLLLLEKIAVNEQTAKVQRIKYVGEEDINQDPDRMSTLVSHRLKYETEFKERIHYAVSIKGRKKDGCNLVNKRILRPCDKFPGVIPRFDMAETDMWELRFCALHRFIQAARKVVICNRANRRLKCLRELIREVKESSYSMTSSENLMSSSNTSSMNQ